MSCLSSSLTDLEGGTPRFQGSTSRPRSCGAGNRGLVANDPTFPQGGALLSSLPGPLPQCSRLFPAPTPVSKGLALLHSQLERRVRVAGSHLKGNLYPRCRHRGGPLSHQCLAQLCHLEAVRLHLRLLRLSDLIRQATQRHVRVLCKRLKPVCEITWAWREHQCVPGLEREG